MGACVYVWGCVCGSGACEAQVRVWLGCVCGSGACVARVRVWLGCVYGSGACVARVCVYGSGACVVRVHVWFGCVFGSERISIETVWEQKWKDDKVIKVYWCRAPRGFGYKCLEYMIEHHRKRRKLIETYFNFNFNCLNITFMLLCAMSVLFQLGTLLIHH